MRFHNRFISYGLIVVLLGMSGCFIGRGGGHHGDSGEGEHHLVGDRR
jgi:hypothetical protein